MRKHFLHPSSYVIVLTSSVMTGFSAGAHLFIDWIVARKNSNNLPRHIILPMTDTAAVINWREYSLPAYEIVA